MPPQQFQRLLEFVDDSLNFSPHENASSLPVDRMDGMTAQPYQRRLEDRTKRDKPQHAHAMCLPEIAIGRT
jgi:hypothetical protein